MLRAAVPVIAVLVLAAAGAAWHFRPGETRLTALPAQIAQAVGRFPKAPAHVVVIVEENKEYSDIAGNVRSAPYLNSLMAHGALFTKSYGVAHPSQPNYLALFAGVTDTNGDGCPPAGINASAPNLSTELRGAHRSFAGYAESLPAAGSRVCRHGLFARKHEPWADFTNVPSNEILPFSMLPGYDRLPTVAFIIPNLVDDMHSASVARGDAWLRAHIAPLVSWAQSHDTLIIITWDESDDAIDNHIPTVFAGPMVRPGRYNMPISHYSVLRTIEEFYGLAPTGAAAGAAPIAGIWKSAAAGS